MNKQNKFKAIKTVGSKNRILDPYWFTLERLTNPSLLAFIYCATFTAFSSFQMLFIVEYDC